LNRTLAWDAELDKKIAALTPDEIVAVMRRRIDPSKLTIVKSGATSPSQPRSRSRSRTEWQVQLASSICE